VAKTAEALEKELAGLKQRIAAANSERDAHKAREEFAKREMVDANRGMLIDAKLKALEDQNAELRKRLDARSYQPSIDDQNAIAAAYHRGNRVYSMLGDSMPLSMPGESSLAYRRRLANGLRRYTKSWKNYAFHDSQHGQDFGLVEDAIYSEAEDYAKNPTVRTGKVREIVTTEHGKTRVEFVGDQRAVWAPFMHPTKFAVTAINRPQGNAYR
jgi:hypothetical protein